ncbi:MAG: inositol 2-dehydrogenase [Promethearchaeota archaeon]
MNAKTVTVGVIGAGRIGKLHVENLLRRIPVARLTRVADVMAEAVRPWVEDLGAPFQLDDDPSALIEDPEIEAVLVCSPTDTHAEYAIEAARAGKHVFTEKPIDFDVSRIREVLSVVEETGVKFQVGFNRRFDRHHKAVRDAVTSGQVGQVHVVKVTSRDPAPPPIDYVKRSGGLFLDMMIHDFDMARYLAGENDEVVEVYASGGVLVDPAIGEVGDVDTAVVILRFESGAFGVIDNSRRAVYGYDQRVEVFGSKGMALDDNELNDTARVFGSESPASAKLPYFFLERYSESYVAELEHFVQAIKKDLSPSPGGKDGLMAVLIGLAAKKSLEEHRPVRVEELA